MYTNVGNLGFQSVRTVDKMMIAIEPSTSNDPSIMKNGRVLLSAIDVPYVCGVESSRVEQSAVW